MYAKKITLLMVFFLLILSNPRSASAQTCPLLRACPNTCCSSSQICYAGKCVTPGKSCTSNSQCSSKEFCELKLKRCLPKKSFDPKCTYRPPIGKFSPTVLWRWRGSSNLPSYKNVMMTPMVMALQDTNGNGKIDERDMPSVIFISHVRGGSKSERGVVRAVRGDNGKELFTTSLNYPVNGLGNLAVGDIDNDGKPEIVAPRFTAKDVSNTGLYAFTNTGKYKWVTRWSNGRVANLPVGWGGPSLADLDGDGNVEVVLGSAVIRGRDGRVLCYNSTVGTGGNGSWRPLSVVADVNDDGKQEIITGNALLNYRCQIIWKNSYRDGFPAVADLNGDKKPEIVVASYFTLRVHDARTGRLLMSTSLPYSDPKRRYGGGPPTIADFNGDKRPDIALAGAEYYAVYSPDFQNKTLRLLWKFRSRDFSSAVTGSSLFDFEGDGKSEVLYNDERFMRVFDGNTGKILFSLRNTSATAVEYPIVVDVNNDGRSEIVFSSNNGSEANIRVFRDSSDNWVNTRNVWNQHAYSVTNICVGGKDKFCPPADNRFGKIPRKPYQNWKFPGLNNFRLNYQGQGLFEAADLQVAGEFQIYRPNCGPTASVGIWFFNLGAKQIPKGIPITFYLNNSKLKTIYSTRILYPGEGEWLTTTFNNLPKSGTLKVVVDDNGAGQSTRNECREKNNSLSTPFRVTGTKEVCNGKDDDCDGKIDESFPQQGKSCKTGKPGICQTGTYSCNRGKLICKQTVPARTEVCNGKDDDCDGKIDESFPENGKSCTRSSPGICKAGKYRCSNGKLQCVPTVRPAPEVCDNKDNDCDGRVDENLTRKCNSKCGVGIELCKAGKWVNCNAPKPKTEVCNGKDDDCDGKADENLTRPCKSKCGSGRETCIAGKWVNCSAPQPKQEDCNGKDDDCDGKIDNLPPRPCVGKCGSGTAKCQNGKWTGCQGPPPKPEVCNGKDDDCDGKIDENITRECSTDCGKGTEVCQNGRWMKCSAPPPKPEVCNGKDDDCDGDVDEGATTLCKKPGEVCFNGLCRKPCNQNECPPGQVCNSQQLCVGKPCKADGDCPSADFTCQNGECLRKRPKSDEQPPSTGEKGGESDSPETTSTEPNASDAGPADDSSVGGFESRRENNSNSKDSRPTVEGGKKKGTAVKGDESPGGSASPAGCSCHGLPGGAPQMVFLLLFLFFLFNSRINRSRASKKSGR